MELSGNGRLIESSGFPFRLVNEAVYKLKKILEENQRITYVTAK